MAALLESPTGDGIFRSFETSIKRVRGAPSWDGVAADPLNFDLAAIQTASAAHSELGRRPAFASINLKMY